MSSGLCTGVSSVAHDATDGHLPNRHLAWCEARNALPTTKSAQLKSLTMRGEVKLVSASKETFVNRTPAPCGGAGPQTNCLARAVDHATRCRTVSTATERKGGAVFGQGIDETQSISSTCHALDGHMAAVQFHD